MTTQTRLFWIVAVCAAPSSWRAAGIGAEPLQTNSTQPTAVDAQQLAAAATGVRQIVAHRGSSADRPENTLASTLRAIEAGATAVEVDVRTTRDGRRVAKKDVERRQDRGLSSANRTYEARARIEDHGLVFERTIVFNLNSFETHRGRYAITTPLEEGGDVAASKYWKRR